MLLNLNTRQHSTIMAALRYWQANATSDRNMTTGDDLLCSLEIADIATNGGEHTPMGDGEIDTLCEGINGGELVITTMEELEQVGLG